MGSGYRSADSSHASYTDTVDIRVFNDSARNDILRLAIEDACEKQPPFPAYGGITIVLYCIKWHCPAGMSKKKISVLQNGIFSI